MKNITLLFLVCLLNAVGCKSEKRQNETIQSSSSTDTMASRIIGDPISFSQDDWNALSKEEKHFVFGQIIKILPDKFSEHDPIYQFLTGTQGACFRAERNEWITWFNKQTPSSINWFEYRRN